MKIAILLLALLVIVGCIDGEGATRVLESNGYTSVEIKGRGFWGCGQGDIYITKFKAQSPNNKAVEGTVCKGLIKSSTIRFD